MLVDMADAHGSYIHVSAAALTTTASTFRRETWYDTGRPKRDENLAGLASAMFTLSLLFLGDLPLAWCRIPAGTGQLR